MTYEMPKLPYANNGLEPVISQATIDYHYGKHLQTYVNNLNALVPGTEFEGKSVEEIVATAPDGGIFNNAGQILNHTLYFLQFTPQPNKHEPSGKLAEAIKRDFGSFDNFKKEMNNASTTLFGILFIRWHEMDDHACRVFFPKRFVGELLGNNDFIGGIEFSFSTDRTDDLIGEEGRGNTLVFDDERQFLLVLVDDISS